MQNEVLHPNRIGHLVPVCCGHTGHQSTEEAYLMEMHLRLAGFIDQKEEAKAAVDLSNAAISNTNTKMDVSQPKVPEFNSIQKKPTENAASSFLPPIKIKLNSS